MIYENNFFVYASYNFYVYFKLKDLNKIIYNYLTVAMTVVTCRVSYQ